MPSGPLGVWEQFRVTFHLAREEARLQEEVGTRFTKRQALTGPLTWKLSADTQGLSTWPQGALQQGGAALTPTGLLVSTWDRCTAAPGGEVTQLGRGGARKLAQVKARAGARPGCPCSHLTATCAWPGGQETASREKATVIKS